MITLTKEQCYHCGDVCLPSSVLLKDDKSFCCTGCLNVYSILSEGGLNNYYKLNQFPGANQNGDSSKFNYLDNEEIAQKLIHYKDEHKTIVTFYIPSVHCSSCIWLLEHLSTLNDSVQENTVDFLKKQVYIQFNNQKSSLKEIAELLTNIGYEPLISLQDVVNKSSNTKNTIIPKIAVAGFCFGNVMLLSFPAYFGIADVDAHYGQFFSLLSLIFCLPAVFYAGIDYFIRAYQSLKQRVLNIDFPLALGIAVLFLRTIADYILNLGEGYADSLTGLVFFLLIGKLVQQKTYHHLSFERDYRSFFPVAVDVIDEKGAAKPTQLEYINKGDRISVKNQEIIPADAILLKGEALIDFSFVTGESEPVKKVWGEVIYAGGKQIGGVIELEVVKKVSQSYLTSLWNNESFLKANRHKSKTFIDKVSHYFSIVLLILASLAFLYWLPQSWQLGLNAFTSILIVACPCALALSTPFTMGAALSILDRNKFYLKNTDVVEHLASIDTLVFDKTGTITVSDKNSVEFTGDSLTDEQKQLIYNCCKNSSHPLSRKICEHLSNNAEVLEVRQYHEVVGNGIKSQVVDTEVKIGSSNFVLGQVTKGKNSSQVFVSINDEYLGYFKINQKLRDKLAVTINELETNYNTFLISGDSHKDKEVLKAVFENDDQMHFQQTPQQKLNFIESYQNKGAKVMMLGDGLNDAGALRQSNVGIAITDDINNFTPGSDAILDGASFHLLPNFLKFSKATVQIIYISFCISICYNIFGLSFAIQGKLSPLIAAILMPLSTVTIVTFTSLATHFKAKKFKLKTS